MNTQMIDYSQILSSRINALRKELGMTQDTLAEKLGVTFQAVSKWENALSCPDIVLLPDIADVFGVSIDSLFGRNEEGDSSSEQIPQCADEEVQKSADPATGAEHAPLPWADDDTLRIGVFRGRSLLAQLPDSVKKIKVELEGDVLAVDSQLSVCCGDISGNITAQGNVSCGDVKGCVTAGGNVDCGDVSGAVQVGGNLDCGDISCSAVAGRRMDAGDVGGETAAFSGGTINCGDVGGDVTAASSVCCGEVCGGVSAGQTVNCGDISGNVEAGGSVSCGDIGGKVTAVGTVFS